jgi:nucleotide-binding universal stress UspA family protein
MKVLVAVSDDRFGEALCSFINNYTWPAHTEFKILHVVEPTGVERLSDVSFAPFLESWEENSIKEANSLVRRVALRIRDKFKTPFVEEEVVKGKPRERILDLAKDWGADLIIVGSHGRSGVDLIMLGSVSNAVVSHSPCSVIVIKLPKSEETTSQQATDGENKSQFVLRS